MVNVCLMCVFSYHNMNILNCLVCIWFGNNWRLQCWNDKIRRLLKISFCNVLRSYIFSILITFFGQLWLNDTNLLQITSGKKLENSLVAALRERILEHTTNLEVFSLKIVPGVDIEKPLKLAQLAIGVVSFPLKGKMSLENCSICCEERPSFMMITLKCSHTFCSHCMRTYVDGKIHSSQVPIRCPELRCKYRISMVDCRSFLTSTSYESLEKTFKEENVLHLDGIYCPFSNCSVLLDPHECLSMRASSSSQSDNSCIECLVCQRSICMDCEVPWHSSMSCEEYQSLPLEERDVIDITLHRQPQNERWRRCQQCRRMIELTQGCYHMTCR